MGVTPVTTPETRVADAVNQYTSIDLDGSGSGSAVTPEHDRRGNLTKDPSARNVGDGGGPTGQKFEYDEENRLVSVKRASDNATLLTIKYDALGRRAESTDYVCAGQPCGTATPVLTRHVFDGIQTTQEYTKCPSQSWALAREFVWGDRFPQPVALIAYGGSGGYGGSGLPSGTSVYHYLHDVLGSVVALTRSDGKVVERYTYDPYGRTVIEQTDPNSGVPVTRSDASVFGNPFAWTGQRYDGGARLYHFLYRTYLPHLGRWGQRDPLRYVDGISLYQYSRSRAMTRTDRLGLWSFWHCLGCAGALAEAKRLGDKCNEEEQDCLDWADSFDDGLCKNIERTADCRQEKLDCMQDALDTVASAVPECAKCIYLRNPGIKKGPLLPAHRKGKSPSKRDKHQRGEGRQKRDQGGEKGDERRRGNPNKRSRQNSMEIRVFGERETLNVTIQNWLGSHMD